MEILDLDLLNMFAAEQQKEAESARPPPVVLKIKPLFTSVTSASLLAEEVVSPRVNNLNVKTLGAAVSASGIVKLSLVDGRLNAAGLSAFAESVNWESAALAEIDVRDNWLLDEASLGRFRITDAS